MAQPAPSIGAYSAVEALMREELAMADRAMASNAPILRHLLRNDDNSIFSDEIVARVRGMFDDVARQLVMALADAAGHADPQAWAHRATGELSTLLAENGAFLAHFHAVALEWQLTGRLLERLGVDPVLSPLVQSRIAHPDADVSATAMGLLAAQARFGQAQRRMQMPLGELPGDLLHIALVTMRTFVGADGGGDGYALVAERTLRARFDEERGRLGLLRRVLRAMDGQVTQALQLEQAGVALFLSALALGSGQSRDAAIMATTDAQLARLALSLAACGLRGDAVVTQFLAIHPDVTVPEALTTLDAASAVAILAESGQ